jgi:hypothetical protein
MVTAFHPLSNWQIKASAWLVPSSAASERNDFSAFAHVHAKLRNRLRYDFVEILVDMQTHNMQFTKQDSKQVGA